MKTTLKFDSECWDKIPAEFLEEIASRYGDLPRMSSKELCGMKMKWEIFEVDEDMKFYKNNQCSDCQRMKCVNGCICDCHPRQFW